MRRSASLRTCLVMLLLVTGTSTACGRPADVAAQTGASTATRASAATSDTGAVSGATSCPARQAQQFAKTRFATNLGLAAGTFHHWIYQPYRAGTFSAGAKGRELVLVKASAAGLFAADQLRDARSDVMADPAMCKGFLRPLATAEKQLRDLAEHLERGDVAQIPAVESALMDITRGATRAGVAITEQNGL